MGLDKRGLSNANRRRMSRGTTTGEGEEKGTEERRSKKPR